MPKGSTRTKCSICGGGLIVINTYHPASGPILISRTRRCRDCGYRFRTVEVRETDYYRLWTTATTLSSFQQILRVLMETNSPTPSLEDKSDEIGQTLVSLRVDDGPGLDRHEGHPPCGGSVGLAPCFRADSGACPVLGGPEKDAPIDEDPIPLEEPSLQTVLVICAVLAAAGIVLAIWLTWAL